MSAIILVHLGSRYIGSVLEDCIGQLVSSQNKETTIYLYVDDIDSVSGVAGLGRVRIVTPNDVPRS
jgi:hypothetical protein